MNVAVYPGSFDPITNGHIDIIRRINKIFSSTVVLLSRSPNKSYLFSDDERREHVENSLSDLENIRVEVFDGLTVDYVRGIGASVIVRGLRAVTDFEYEMSMASMNQKIAPDIETVLVFARPEFYYVSSRAVKEVALYGGDLEGLVPEHVKTVLTKRLAERIKSRP